MTPRRLPVAVLISGNGSNLQAFIDRQHELGIELVGVVSNNASAFGLRRASDAGIPTAVVSARRDQSREDYDARLLTAVDTFRPALLVLAGFMRILSAPFVRHYNGRMLNVHPSLLPAYRGLHTHRRVLEAGDREHGCSVHFVNDELDGGPVVAQAVIAIRSGDDEESLSARVQAREHKLFPLVANWFATGRLSVEGEQVRLDGRTLHRPVRFGPHEEIL